MTKKDGWLDFALTVVLNSTESLVAVAVRDGFDTLSWNALHMLHVQDGSLDARCPSEPEFEQSFRAGAQCFPPDREDTGYRISSRGNQESHKEHSRKRALAGTVLRYMQTREVCISQKIMDVMICGRTGALVVKETGSKEPNSYQHMGISASGNFCAYFLISEQNTPDIRIQPPFSSFFRYLSSQNAIITISCGSHNVFRVQAKSRTSTHPHEKSQCSPPSRPCISICGGIKISTDHTDLQMPI